jgi:serine/threonine protein kinase/tetratricopeptide (TPR) repeat protein
MLARFVVREPTQSQCTPSQRMPVNEETLFHLVLTKPAEQRTGFLAEVCTDPILRERVSVLIAAHAAADGFLGPPIFDGAALAEPVDAPGVRGEATTTIGPYRLLHKLGEGGMGIVYLAEQSQPVARRVALKLLREGRDSRAVITRFEAERQALAVMDHPNIARVFDAGTTPSGLPYFVMELVQGTPITTYCDEHQLTLHQRVELLVQVCRAIQHAHQRGIIHRDLKPSNVLVTEYDGAPVPKVIDFGVSKATARKLDAETLATEFGAVIGTLQYMSPEQAGSNPIDIDTRSDIYSLGVLLYELLTGTTPIERKRVQESAFLEVVRLIREQDAPRPSARLAAIGRAPDGAWITQVKGELDWIAMKALEKDRDQRYESAGALAADLLHYLRDEPVAACPPSAAYRLRKFARRHRTRLVVAAGFLLLLVASTVVSVWLAIVANRESNDKEAARQEAAAATVQSLEALASLTDGVLARLLTRQVQVTAQDREFLRSVLARYEALAAQKGGGRESRAIRAEGLFRVGLLRMRLGEGDPARDAFRDALAGYRQLGEDFPFDPSYRLAAAKACTNLGLLLLDRGEWDESEGMQRESLAIGERLLAEFPADPNCRDMVASTRINLAKLWSVVGNVDAEVAELRAAERPLEELASSHPGAERRSELAQCLDSLAVSLRRRGNSTEAVAVHRRALDLLLGMVQEFPDQAAYREQLARAHSNLAVALHDGDEAAAAQAEAQQAANIQTQLTADFPTVPGYRVELARSLTNLATLVGDTDPAAAEGHCRRALEIQELLIAHFPEAPEHRSDLATTHDKLGDVLQSSGREREGDAALQTAIQLRERLAKEHPQVAQYAIDLAGSHCNLGNVFLAQRGEPAQSLAWYDKAITGLRAVLAAQPHLATARAYLRNSYEGRYQALHLLGRTDDALADVDRLLELCDGTASPLARLGRFEVLIDADPVRAMAELDRVAAEPSVPHQTLYYGVVLLCQVASAGEPEQRNTYTARAMALLEQLLSRGYFLGPEARKQLETDPRIETLREREDFRALGGRVERQLLACVLISELL